MKIGSLFTGIGGFDLAFEMAGFETAFQVEIDPACQVLLRDAFKEVSLHADVKNVGKNNVPYVDVLTGGFPCQDLSVAGHRAGLAGPRSGLWYEFHRIIGELEPEWCVIENVPGLLSSNAGRDFAILIGGLTGTIPEVPKNGWRSSGFARGWYNIAWRVLDAQHFGVAQRRRRLFIVGHIGELGRLGKSQSRQDARRLSGLSASILFEPESVCRDLETRTKPTETYSEVAGTLAASGGGLDRPSRSGNMLDFVMPAAFDVRNLRMQEEGLSGTLQSKSTGGYSLSYINPIIAKTLTTKNQRLDPELETYIVSTAHTGANQYPWKRSDVSDTIDTSGGRGFGLAGFFGVRRLTPTECERLQGFPVGWTNGFSDSTRYHMLGNAVCVPNVYWIARRIAEHYPPSGGLPEIFEKTGILELSTRRLPHTQGTPEGRK